MPTPNDPIENPNSQYVSGDGGGTESIPGIDYGDGGNDQGDDVIGVTYGGGPRPVRPPIGPPRPPTAPPVIIDPNNPPIGPPTPQPIVDCQRLSGELRNRILDAINDCRAASMESIESCCNCITARIGGIINTATNAISRCNGTLSRELGRIVGDLHVFASSCGCSLATAPLVTLVDPATGGAATDTIIGTVDPGPGGGPGGGGPGGSVGIDTTPGSEVTVPLPSCPAPVINVPPCPAPPPSQPPIFTAPPPGAPPMPSFPPPPGSSWVWSPTQNDWTIYPNPTQPPSPPPNVNVTCEPPKPGDPPPIGVVQGESATSVSGSGLFVCDPDTAVSWSKSFLSGPTPVIDTLSNAFGVGNAGDGVHVPNWLTGLSAVIQGWPVANGIASAFKFLTEAGQGKIKSMPSQLGCDGALMASLIAQWSFTHWGGTVLGEPPPPVSRAIEYKLNLACPSIIPTTDQFNDLHNRGFLTNDQWSVGVRLNGHCDQWQELIKRSTQTRLNVNDTVAAYRRKLIDDSGFSQLMGFNGVVSDSQRELFYQITEQRPGIADIVHFMVRDAADDEVARKYGYDTDFTTKYTGKLRKWSEDQGIPEDIAKFAWRSHWELPSPTQLYEMLHRLRPNRPKTGGDFDDVTVTLEDVQKALEINDYAPGWIRQLMAVSYAPLTRVDVRRAYEIGVLDADAVYAAYRDIGYDDSNAKILTRFTEKLSGPKKAVLAGAMPLADLRTAYLDNAISDDEALAGVFDLGYDEAEVQGIVTTWKLKRDAVERREAIKGLKARYMQGDFDLAELQDWLVRYGVPAERATQLANIWRLTREARKKIPTAKMLCRWWSENLITLDEYIRRLKNLGWKEADALKIASVCVNDETERRRKELEAAMKRIEAAAEKERKRREAERKRLQPCRDRPKPLCPPAADTNGVH